MISSIRAEVKWQLRRVVGTRPALCLAIERLRPRIREVVVRRDTEVVIEGYPRSGNTFAVAAFELAQGRPVRIARHLHQPAQVIQAVKWSIPTLVLIRNPEDAVVSFLLREPHARVGHALRAYAWYYRALRPYAGGFVLARFEEVVRDFGSVIAKLNDAFGTRFRLFEHTEQNVARAFARIEQMHKALTGRDEVDEVAIARPSPRRESLAESYKSSLRSAGIAPLLAAAEEAYREMLDSRRAA